MRFSILLFALASLAAPASGLARAAVFPLWPDTQIVGEIRHVKTREGETLRDIAARFDIGASELARLNAGVDPARPEPGTWITLPTQFVLPDVPRAGLVINVAEERVYYYVRSILGRGAEVMVFPAVLGRRDWTAMLGAARIAAKLEDAGASVPASYAAKKPPAPVDAAVRAKGLALRLDVGGCLIQAIEPHERGDRNSAPCVGLSAKDLAILYEEVRDGTPARIVDQPYKAGWRDGALYLESHASRRDHASRSVTPAVRAIIHATGDRRPAIDWDVVRRVAEEASGVPVRVSR